MAQTRDVTAVRVLLEEVGPVPVGLDNPATCLIAASSDGKVVGAVAVETMVDRALIRSLVVKEPWRRRGLGTRLITAARSAAHTRGARSLIAFSDCCNGSYFKQHGFVAINSGDAVRTLEDSFAMGRDLQSEDFPERRAWKLDISSDGIVER